MFQKGKRTVSLRRGNKERGLRMASAESAQRGSMLVDSIRIHFYYAFQVHAEWQEGSKERARDIVTGAPASAHWQLAASFLEKGIQSLAEDGSFERHRLGPDSGWTPAYRFAFRDDHTVICYDTRGSAPVVMEPRRVQGSDTQPRPISCDLSTLFSMTDRGLGFCEVTLATSPSTSCEEPPYTTADVLGMLNAAPRHTIGHNEDATQIAPRGGRGERTTLSQHWASRYTRIVIDRLDAVMGQHFKVPVAIAPWDPWAFGDSTNCDYQVPYTIVVLEQAKSQFEEEFLEKPPSRDQVILNRAARLGDIVSISERLLHADSNDTLNWQLAEDRGYASASTRTIINHNLNTRLFYAVAPLCTLCICQEGWRDRFPVKPSVDSVRGSVASLLMRRHLGLLLHTKIDHILTDLDPRGTRTTREIVPFWSELSALKEMVCLILNDPSMFLFDGHTGAQVHARLSEQLGVPRTEELAVRRLEAAEDAIKDYLGLLRDESVRKYVDEVNEASGRSRS